jgi:hypothetical protein
MRHYATVFDFKYLPKGLVLYWTLMKQSPTSTLYILAIDKATYIYLQRKRLKNVVIVSMEQATSPELEQARENRNHTEFCWTLGSYFTEWIMRTCNLSEVTYLDSDLAFFDNPELVHEEIGDCSIGVIPHRLIPEKKHLEVNGLFNVSWVTFRGEVGKACLTKWRGQCLEWCYYRVEANRFGDQKYLDAWPKAYG